MEELQEIERRKRVYLGERAGINLEGKDLILVDDGIATGLTVKAAILSLRKKKPLRIILAIPVIPKDKVQEFLELVNDLVVLHVPEYFSAVGEFYEDFSQTSDEEVIDIIRNFKEK
ncbi:MAG: phosphoribosyltransferase family protein [Desulfurobacteriaceae bacterium]